MKEYFSSINKKGKKYIVLSIVALVEILALMMVSTYAWVETVSTIRIYTSSSAEAKQPANPTGQFLNHVSHIASLSTSSNDDIDLAQMYHESGAFHLAPASSADGKNIFFPHINGDSTNNDFRKADSSDNMVNYVSFSFKVAAAGYYVFDADPTISFGGTAVASDSTLVRLSLQVGEGTPDIYSKGTSTAAVVNTISGGTASTNVRAFSSYTGGNGNYALHTTSANQIVTVRLWIQDPTHASSTTYTGKQLSITNLKLVPAYAVRARVSVDKAVANNTNVGSVGLGTSASPTASVNSVLKYYKAGDTAYFNSVKNSSATNYTFVGWSNTVNDTSPSVTSATTTYTVVAPSTPTTIKEYYAIFLSSHSVTAYSYQGKTGTTASTSTLGGTVKVGNGTASNTSATGSVTYGSSVTLTASAYSGWGFVGWYSSSTATNPASTNATYTVSNVTANKTYYARFEKIPWQVKGDFDSWAGTTMVKEQENVYSVTVNLAEGNNNYKIYNTDTSTWYGINNENEYKYGFGSNGQSSSYTKLANYQLYPGDEYHDAHFVTHAGKYKYTFYSDTEQVCIDFVSYNNITITCDYSGFSDWGNDSSKCKFYCAASSNSINDLMTKDTTNKKFTYTMSSSYGNYSTNVHFTRGSGTASSYSTWNDCAAGKRGYSTTYKVTGWTSGAWD